MKQIGDFLKRVLGMSETQTGDETIRELGVGQNESNRPHSPVYRVFKSITNKCSSFGSSSGVASRTITSSPTRERPNPSPQSFNPPRDELSTPSGDNYSSVGSVPPNHEDVGLPNDHAGVEFQDLTSPLGPGTPIVGTSPGNPSRVYCRVHRMRLHVSPQDRLDSSNALVNYYHVIDIDLETGGDDGYRPSRVVPRMKLGKTFLGLTYQAMYSFLIFHYQAAGSTSSQDHSPKSSHILLQIAEVNLTLGFAATLIAILLRQACPEKSVIIERVGSMSAAFGFFLMMSMLLKSIPEWFGWICALGALLAFVIAFVKKKND